MIENVKLYLGEYIKGNLLDMVDHSWLFELSQKSLGLHHVILGASGSGKTETTLRIAQGARLLYGMKVIFIDAKGDFETAEKFLASMYDTGISKISYFPGTSYDAWRGNRRALFNKLLSILDFDQRAPYWKSVAEKIVWLALTSSAGIPRNGKDFLSLLNQKVLRGLYRGKEEEDIITNMKVDVFEGVSLRYHAFFDALQGKLDGKVAFEDMDACYILIPGFSLKLEAASLGRFFMEEVSQYLAGRKKQDEKIIFVIDEYSAIRESSAQSAVNLATRARSFGAGIILTAQSYAGLGSDQEAEEILDSVNGIILHSCSNPEKLVSRAGTKKVPEVGRQFDNGEFTGMGTSRVQEQFRVSPNEVRTLYQGECVYISGGRSATIQVQMLQVSSEGLSLARQHFKTSQEQEAVIPFKAQKISPKVKPPQQNQRVPQPPSKPIKFNRKPTPGGIDAKLSS